MAISRGAVAPTRHDEKRKHALGPSTRLQVVNARRLKEASRRRRARALLILGCAIVITSLLSIVAAQAMVASEQVKIDSIQQELASSATVSQNLELERSMLDAPTRILSEAEHSLDMVAPASVTYLAPVDIDPVLSAQKKS